MTSLSNKFGKKTESAYVTMVDVANQYNVRNSSCINMEVPVFNRTMHKIMKNFQHTQTQHMTEERKHCLHTGCT